MFKKQPKTEQPIQPIETKPAQTFPSLYWDRDPNGNGFFALGKQMRLVVFKYFDEAGAQSWHWYTQDLDNTEGAPIYNSYGHNTDQNSIQPGYKTWYEAALVAEAVDAKPISHASGGEIKSGGFNLVGEIG